MEIIIKEYESKYRKQLKTFLLAYPGDTSLINLIDSSDYKLAYTAFEENILVGFLIVWKREFHPYCTYFQILSNPIYNMEAILLDKLNVPEINHFPVQTSIWETSVHLKRLYENNGFKEIRKTYMPKLNILNVKPEMPFNNQFKVKTLAEILSDKRLMAKLIQRVKNNYEKAHKANPVAEVEAEKWKGLILSEDLILEGSYIYADVKEQDIIAYSFLHEADAGNALELGWCGANGSHHKHLIPHLIIYQINYCKTRHVSFLTGEFDTTDDYAMSVYQSFPFDLCPAWITYQK